MAEYTLEELRTAGLAPGMELLIRAAKNGELVTYGELASHLEQALGKNRINPRQIGWVAGPLMDRLFEIDDTAPLINLLVVRGDSDQPGKGANPYLRKRFGLRGPIGTSRRRKYVQAGLNEVWSHVGWERLFRRAFGRPPADLTTAPDQLEEDGQRDNPRYGGVPESEEHKRLKLHVLQNPACLRLKLVEPFGTLEKRLLSGDEMDVEFISGARRIGIEVKSIRSVRDDLIRGIYQCVKYRAVMTAQSGFDEADAQCEVVLVTEQPLPSDLRTLAKRLSIPLRVVPVN